MDQIQTAGSVSFIEKQKHFASLLKRLGSWPGFQMAFNEKFCQNASDCCVLLLQEASTDEERAAVSRKIQVLATQLSQLTQQKYMIYERAQMTIKIYSDDPSPVNLKMIEDDVAMLYLNPN